GTALMQQYEVYIVAGNELQKDLFESLGFKFVFIPLSRGGINILSEFEAFIRIRSVLREIKPDIIHMFTIKPVIYGGLACKTLKLSNLKLKVFSITGLGTIALSQRFFSKLLWRLLEKTYSFVFSGSNTAVIFENTDDKQLFIVNKLIAPEKAYIVNGAGIDTSLFVPSKFKSEKTTVVLVARLLQDKGILEYISAGEILKYRDCDVKLQLVGSIDIHNRTSLTQEVIDEAHKKGYIEYLGQSNNINGIYQKAHIACLPSYREGLPKSLIEAASCGLAIITTDVPGCRQMIFNSENGLLIPPKKAVPLADAIEYLVSDPKLIISMGKKSREISLRVFDYTVIIDSFFKIYDLGRK
ncbi:MAG: glycosyltransferase family 4 protein, partial [Colwellia sp.]